MPMKHGHSLDYACPGVGHVVSDTDTYLHWIIWFS